MRKDRLGIKKQLISDYAGQQHIHFIFHRALRRFAEDVGIWLQYIDFCMRTNSAKQLSSAFARALSRHPRVPALWVQAAAWEFDRNHDIPAARKMLQRFLDALYFGNGELFTVAKARLRRA